MTESIVLQYGTSVADKETPLVIKQEEWSLYLGKVTKQATVRFLLGVVSESAYSSLVECGMTGDSLIVPVHCYPLYKETEYQIYTSYGELSERYVETVDVDGELIQFRMSSAEKTDFPIRHLKSVEWVLDCLDSEGVELTSNPELSIDGRTLSTNGVPVYGTASISYTTERHYYILTVPRREEALDNNYSGLIVGIVTGYEPVVHELEMPPTVEAFDNNPYYKCGRVNTGFIIDTDKQQPLPDVPSRDLITVVDYCKQEIIREYID